MKHTPLYEQHVRDASAVINLKGFARALQYRGHVAEHRATREQASVCDVSHMGELEFVGPDALALVQKLITNDAGKLAVNQALYSVMCDERGMVIDDLVCYRLAADRFVWVVNVTKTDDDYQWVLRHARGMDVKVRNLSTDTALMALQGPESREVLQRIARADLSTLKYYWLAQTSVHTRHAEVPCMISRTGYTGERGYEIMVARDLAPWIWDELLMVGRPLGILPQGVAARESLRTEAGYLLNGNDMDGETDPFEAGLGWVVRFLEGLHRQGCAHADQGAGREAKAGRPRSAGPWNRAPRLPDPREWQTGWEGHERPRVARLERAQSRTRLRYDRACPRGGGAGGGHRRQEIQGARRLTRIQPAQGQGRARGPYVLSV
jgi:aminomethyltransferase